MAQDFQRIIFGAITDLLEPLSRAATDDVFRRQLFRQLGWETGADTGFPEQNLISALNSFSSAFQTMETALASPPTTLDGLKNAFDAVGNAIKTLSQVSALANAGASAEFSTAADQLLSKLLIDKWQGDHRVLYALLRLLTIIRDQTSDLVMASDGVTVRRSSVQYQILDFDRVLALLKSPVSTLRGQYGLTNGLTDANGTADTLFPRIVDLLVAMGVQAQYGIQPTVTPVDLDVAGNDIAAHTLSLFRALPTADLSLGGGFGFGIALDELLGVVLSPFGVAQISDALGDWLASGLLTFSPDGLAIKGPVVTFVSANESASLQLTLRRAPNADEVNDSNGTSFVIGAANGTHVVIGDFSIVLDAEFSSSKNEFGVTVGTGQSMLVLSAGDGDGFLGSVLPANTPISFDLEVGWSRSHGLHFKGSASLEVDLPVNITVGPVSISNARLLIAAGDTAGTVTASADLGVELGPVTAAVQDLGAKLVLSFPPGGGSLGPAAASLAFKPPTGLGISVDAGPVSGGGFLSFDPPNNRYGGAVELSVYSIAVKAFGLVETKLPTGPGYSFVIIISAEFTPIQLGLGFTLTGVGGLVGINRTVDGAALTSAVLKGNLDAILFPHDVVQNAPTLIHDLQSFFPAAKGRYVFGPLAKIGWGTPTLVEGKLGLLLELPGPILTIIGNIQAHLPKSAPGGEALVKLNLDISGRLDFPKKHFELDGALHDSKVGDYPVSGAMAMRLDWGDNPNFAISLGGFNPTFNPPSGFPPLQRITVDLGLTKNPRVTLAGYMALTSNTAQIGAELDAWASNYGGTLSGKLGFDAIFVFSPFSFNVDLHGSLRADWDGWGGTLSFHGSISGPTPWRISGEVCVSVWFLSACVHLDKTLSSTTASAPLLPSLDPWTGDPAGDALSDQTAPGLQAAIQEVRNWSGVVPPSGATGVTYAPVPSAGAIPIDPLGVATFRQKAVPLDFPITQFAGTKPLHAGPISVTAVKIGGVPIASAPPTVPVLDYFAPAQFRAMSTAEKLSSPSFESLHAGFSIQSPAVSVGPFQPETPAYDTKVLDVNGNIVPNPPAYSPSQLHLTGMASGTGAGRLGIRFTGATRFTDPSVPRKVTELPETYVAINKTALVSIATPPGGTRAEASDLVDGLSAGGSLARRQFQAVPSHLLPAA